MVTPDEAAGDAFRLEGVGLTVARATILRDVTLSFPRARVTALVGHNGSGKSTLLRIMARQVAAGTGRVLYDAHPVADFVERAFAREVAWLPQDPGTGADLTVREVVASGRYPWHGPLGRFTDADRQRVEDALAAVHLQGFGERPLATLSGGERQRAWLGMLIAQDSKCLLLDEPTAALDIAHQVEVLSLIRRLSHDHGLAVVIVMHDINMAARFCDLIHALKAGEVAASGPPARIVTPEVLHRIYGIAMDVLVQPGRDVPIACVR